MIIDDNVKSFNNLLFQINYIIDKYIPLKNSTNKEYKRRFKPWISKVFLEVLKETMTCLKIKKM